MAGRTNQYVGFCGPTASPEGEMARAPDSEETGGRSGIREDRFRDPRVLGLASRLPQYVHSIPAVPVCQVRSLACF